jgi:hypothetical protein
VLELQPREGRELGAIGGAVRVFGACQVSLPTRLGENLRLGDVLKRSGVFKEPTRDLKRVKVYRVGEDGNVLEVEIDWDAKSSGAEDVVLRAGDAVEVPVRRVAL